MISKFIIKSKNMKDIKVIINNHEVGNLFFEKEKNLYGFNYTQNFKPISFGT